MRQSGPGNISPKDKRTFLFNTGLVRPCFQEVIGAGWDQADINNYVLSYNRMSGSSPCGTRTSSGYEHEEGHQHHHLNQAASTRRGQEEEQEEEEEIGLITPANPKGPSTGEPPEPDLGMLPPGPRKTVGGQPKPSTSAQQRPVPKSKPSARSVMRSSSRIEKGTSKEEGGSTQEGSS